MKATPKMKKRLKRVQAYLLAFAMCGGLVLAAPVQAQAATAQRIPSGASVTLATPGLYNLATAVGGGVVHIEANGVALTGTNSNLTLWIEAGVTVTLKDAHISNMNYLGALYVEGSGCGLILVGANSVTANPAYPGSAGVKVPMGSSLVIEGPGSLTAQGGSQGPGIGGDQLNLIGAITIRHATVTATGGTSAAGIGGGLNCGTSNITIENASVVSTGGNGSAYDGGAGIGGGGTYSRSGNDGENISIDAASAVWAVGGAGGPSNNFDGGGGGGAGIGGGGKGRGSGAGINITLGGPLAAGSAGGAGGPSSGDSTVYGPGGAGALCGSGGSGGSSFDGTPGASGTEFDLTGNGIFAQVGPHTVDFDAWPSPSYAGYPALPAVTAPQPQQFREGGAASFSVSASGGNSQAYYYQWQVSDNGGASWADISGETTPTLALANLQLADSGKQYRCVVNDFVWREGISAAAALTLAVPTTANKTSTADDFWLPVLAQLQTLGTSATLKIDAGSQNYVPHYILQALHGTNKTLAATASGTVFALNGKNLSKLDVNNNASFGDLLNLGFAKSSIAHTGDGSNLPLWAGLGVLALAWLSLCGARLRRRAGGKLR